jgi:hypothetical protein
LPGISFQPVQVATGDDEDGLLVFADGLLVGVLVRLSDQHGEMAGRWFVEAAFGPVADMVVRPTFPDVEAVQDWLSERLRRASA